MNPETGIAERSQPASTRQQAESCGRCHSRRGTMTQEYEYGKPLTDTHMPSLLAENLYHPDGRIQDEVYVYGSFVQSKMYAAGVTCSDCHNPHSGALRTGPDPNAVCAQCHLPTKFASAEHAESDIGNCVDCHMPATIYMGVDDRRDHSFRLPDAGQQPDHYGQAIAAGRRGGSNAELLDALANRSFPAIARATILTLLEPPLAEDDALLLLEALDDPDPLVRIGALRSLRDQPPAHRMKSGSHLLRDPVRGVRVEAALTYVDYRDLLPAIDARAYPGAADDYRDYMKAAITMPGAALRIAEFETQNGNIEQSQRHYELAIRLQPNLAANQHAYGLFLVRSGQADDALVHLRKAAQLEPGVSRFVYVLGVALNSLGQSDAAIATLSQARLEFPDDYDIAWALATMLRDAGDLEAAVEVAEDLQRQYPNDAQVRSLFEILTTAN
jgi:tetratricopeptide (TPR) repeat protein